MKILAVDVGGSTVQCIATDQDNSVKFRSGPRLMAAPMMNGTDVVERFRKALLPDWIVPGGSHAAYLQELPPPARLGGNADAVPGGLRWRGRQNQSFAGKAGQP